MSENGYNSDAITTYIQSNVINSLKNSRPIGISGFTEKEEGHTWVIDGAYKKERSTTEYIYEYKYSGRPPAEFNPNDWTLVDKTVTKETQEFVHCNYGYEGMFDGYYEHGVFDLHDSSVSTGPSYNEDLIILTNIKRK